MLVWWAISSCAVRWGSRFWGWRRADFFIFFFFSFFFFGWLGEDGEVEDEDKEDQGVGVCGVAAAGEAVDNAGDHDGPALDLRGAADGGRGDVGDKGAQRLACLFSSP